jgi:hypothetical protein
VFARVTTFTGTPEQIDEGLRLYREQALPWLREASGFRGFVALVDRAGGRSMGLTLWASADVAADADTSGRSLREQISEGIGLTMESLDVFEVAFAEGVDLGEP